MDEALRRQAVASLHELTESGALRVAVGEVFDFDRIAAAHEAVERRSRIGGVVIAIP
jgi:NADPH:quinone reductase-like Zn-dependent oxidoreductase